MDEVVLLGISVNLLVLAVLIERLRGKKEHSERLDDITEGLGVLANELLARTEELLKLRDFMPEISLVNQNPLASLGEFIRALRGDMSGDTNISPRGSDGRYATPPQVEETTPSHETVDVGN